MKFEDAIIEARAGKLIKLPKYQHALRIIGSHGTEWFSTEDGFTKIISDEDYASEAWEVVEENK